MERTPKLDIKREYLHFPFITTQQWETGASGIQSYEDRELINKHEEGEKKEGWLTFDPYLWAQGVKQRMENQPEVWLKKIRMR